MAGGRRSNKKQSAGGNEKRGKSNKNNNNKQQTPKKGTRNSRRLSNDKSASTPTRKGSKSKSKKRNADSNEPSCLTPSRAQPKSVQKTNKQSSRASKLAGDFNPPADPTKSTIKDIKVEGVSLKNKQAFYTVYLNNCRSANGKVKIGTFKVGTVKHVWDANERGEEPYFCMMHIFA